MIYFFIEMFIVVPFTGYNIFKYLTLSLKLVETLPDEAPDLWQALDKPERIYVNQGQGGIHTIKPLGPWLNWVIWDGMERVNIPLSVKKQYQAIRKHGLWGLAGMAGFIIIFFLIPID